MEKRYEPTDTHLRKKIKRGEIPDRSFVIQLISTLLSTVAILYILYYTIQVKPEWIHFWQGRGSVDDIPVMPLFIVLIFPACQYVLSVIIAIKSCKGNFLKYRKIFDLKRLSPGPKIAQMKVRFTMLPLKFLYVLLVGFSSYFSLGETFVQEYFLLFFLPSQRMRANLLNIVAQIVMCLAVAFTVCALFEYFFTGNQFKKKSRMNRKEIEDEQKESEGDPRLKSRRFELANAESLETAVKKSKVILIEREHEAER